MTVPHLKKLIKGSEVPNLHYTGDNFQHKQFPQEEFLRATITRDVQGEGQQWQLLGIFKSLCSKT